MKIELSAEEAGALRLVVEEALSDLGVEIAATDNAEYRRGLVARRQHLSGALSRLSGS
ncbi:MAG TPA: hypothetical protein VKG43_05425 [Acidimicrobiales bacterium]|nr:hypothetical protein [Acidimicrobiales bacterium]